MLLVVDVLPWLSPRWLVLQNYAVWDFGLSRNPGNEFMGQFTRQQMWYIENAISLWERCNPAIQTFWLQQTHTLRKSFSFECSAIVGSLPEKGL